jgi:muramidase (phage lysozyme)
MSIEAERARLRALGQDPNVARLLPTIRYAEGTLGSDGYNTTFGYKKFSSLDDHPRMLVKSGKYASDAAGAYQALSTTWDEARQKVGLKSFAPEEQDLFGLHVADGALAHLGGLGYVAKHGLDVKVADALSGKWASFPTERTGTSAYGQGGKSYAELAAFYEKRGGVPPTARPGPAAPRGGAGTPGAAPPVEMPSLPSPDGDLGPDEPAFKPPPAIEVNPISSSPLLAQAAAPIETDGTRTGMAVNAPARIGVQRMAGGSGLEQLLKLAGLA